MLWRIALLCTSVHWSLAGKTSEQRVCVHVGACRVTIVTFDVSFRDGKTHKKEKKRWHRERRATRASQLECVFFCFFLFHRDQ